MTTHVIGPQSTDALTSPLTSPLTSIADRLGVLGWHHLDPLLLAALALEAPVLLVGGHGTGKTLLVERVAAALGQEFRHYNASLLNYDDLVGIPLPDADGGLRFVGTAGAVWGAEFAFFDEINRCAPELQNKMFPIVHERRIAGHSLSALQHRWAAMNPPNSEEHDHYLGVEELDPALADRFVFIVRTPGWSQLERDERLALAAGTVDGAQLEPGALADAVALVRAALADRSDLDLLAEWAVSVADILAPTEARISPRRVRMLTRAAQAVAVSHDVLGRNIALEDAAELALLNCLPHVALGVEISYARVIGAHRQAWEVMGEQDSGLAVLLQQPDPVERIRMGLAMDLDERALSRLITAGVHDQPSRGDKVALSVVLTRALAGRALTPAAWGVLFEHAARALTPKTGCDVDRTVPQVRGEPPLVQAMVLGLGRQGARDVDLDQLVVRFKAWARDFEVELDA